MVIPANVLEYGVFGILFAVLVAVGGFLRSYMLKEQERQAERDKAGREDRAKLNDAFTELVAKDVEAKVQLTVTMSGLCAEVQAYQAGFKALADRLDKSEQRAQSRHEQQMKQQVEQAKQAAERHAELVTALKALNGKRPE